MAKYSGKIGFRVSYEKRPGIFIDTITEKVYRGDVISNSQRNQNSDGLNDNVIIDNTIEIISNDFASTNLNNIKYATWKGIRWDVTKVQYLDDNPRLVLRLGGVYNGQTPD